jgi:Domain of unknown function (DUF1707)
VSSPVDPDAMRAANADRERVVEQLNTAFAEGRLDVGELDERVAAAYAAKTMGELKPLTVDLPAAGSVARRTSSAPPQHVAGAEVAHKDERKESRVAVAGMTGVFVLNVAIWGVISLAAGNLIYFWPVWILIPVAIAMIRMVAVHAGGGGRR